MLVVRLQGENKALKAEVGSCFKSPHRTILRCAERVAAPVAGRPTAQWRSRACEMRAATRPPCTADCPCHPHRRTSCGGSTAIRTPNSALCTTTSEQAWLGRPCVARLGGARGASHAAMPPRVGSLTLSSTVAPQPLPSWGPLRHMRPFNPTLRYLPLKEQAGELRREVAALQKRVVAEELKVGEGSGGT